MSLLAENIDVRCKLSIRYFANCFVLLQDTIKFAGSALSYDFEVKRCEKLLYCIYICSCVTILIICYLSWKEFITYVNLYTDVI